MRLKITVTKGSQIIIKAHRSRKQCAALMAHEYFGVCVICVPPQKTNNESEFSSLRPNATAKGNWSRGTQKKIISNFTEKVFLLLEVFSRLLVFSLFLAGVPFTIGLGCGDELNTSIIDIKRQPLNNAETPIATILPAENKRAQF